MNSGQGQGYQQDGSGYSGDQNQLNQAWVLPADQYGHQQTFNPQQETFQQYPTSTSYSSYGLPQASSYPVSPYHSNYAPQYQQHLDPYPAVQYPMPTQAPSVTQQTFLGATTPYPYGTFGAEAPTISPQALQMVDLNASLSQRGANLSGSQHSIEANPTFPQDWDRNVTGGFQHPSDVSPAVGYTQQTSARGNVGAYSSSGSAGGLAQTVETRTQTTEAPKTTATPRVLSSAQQQSLRITYPELLSATERLSSRRLKLAPFVVVGDAPIELEITGKIKLPTLKPAKIKTTKIGVPGSEELNASVPSSAVQIKKSRIRPPKSIAANAKPTKTDVGSGQTQTGEVKPRLTGSKPGDSSPSSEEQSSSEDETGSSEESDDETEEYKEMAPEELSDVRAADRPTEAAAAAAWDATGIVFVSRHRYATKSEIGEAVQEYSKFFVKLRDDLKTASADLAAAEAEKRLEDAKILRATRSLKRNVVCSALEATIQYGHREIKAWFGKNERLVVALVSVLISCVKAKDFDSNLPRLIFELMSQFDHLTDDLLQRAKYEGAEKRFLASDKTEAKVKEFIHTIRSKTTESVRRATKVEQESLIAEKKKSILSSQESLKIRKVEDVGKLGSASSGQKRSLEVDTNSGKPNKKIASDATAVGSTQKAAMAKPRSTNLFASLKRPGLKSSTAPKTNTAPVRKPDVKPEPISTPQSSLAEILASIEKPREVEKVSEAPPRAPETPEEKARRERKESRRHLRVRWKDGSALVEVKLFRHEQAEDEGRQDNMLRDAHDDRSEGMMLKQRVLENMIDEEDDVAGEVEYRPYSELSSIDFSGMSRESEEKNFITKGGRLIVSSTQQQVQDRREALELMVVYTDPSDIPSSPKEPPLENHEKAQAERKFGQPITTWLVQRLQEIYQYGYTTAISIFIRRLEEQRLRVNRNDRSANAPYIPSNTTTDITSILNAMKGLPGQSQPPVASDFGSKHPSSNQTKINNFTSAFQQTTNPQQSQPGTLSSSNHNHTMDPDAFANLFRVLESLKGKPYPPTEPPEWMNVRQKAEWWEGFKRDAAFTGGMVAEERSAHLHAPLPQKPQTQVNVHTSQVQVTQMQYPQMTSYSNSNTQAPNSAAASTTYDLSQLQTIYAGLNNVQHNSVPPQLQDIFAGLNSQGNSSVPQQQQSWVGGWTGGSSGSTNVQGYTSQNQPTQWDSSWSTAASTGDQHPTFDAANHDSKDRDRDGGHAGDDRHRSTNPSDYKRNTKPCKFWLEGKCAKGANCTFRHDPRD